MESINKRQVYFYIGSEGNLLNLFAALRPEMIKQDFKNLL